MPYAFVNSGQFHNSAGAVGSVSYSATLGNTLIVPVLSTTATPTITDGSNTYTLLGATAALASNFLALFLAPVTTGGALTISSGATFGIYVAEYSGLAASAFIAGSFQSNTQVPNAIGADILTTTSNPNVTSIPAMLWGFCVDINGLSGTEPGPTAGTTPISYAATSHAAGWLGTGSNQTALAEDTRITSTGSTAPITFGTVSGNQFSGYLTVAAAFIEGGASINTPPAPIYHRKNVLYFI
jgi:hypothetical protein